MSDTEHEPEAEPDGEPEITEEDAAEQEPDERIETADEPEQEPEPQGVSEQEAERIFAAFDRERERHGKEVKKALGPLYDGWDVCPLCEAHGFYLATIPEPEATARREYVHAALGAGNGPEYREHPTRGKCPTCDGWGQLRTGSHVPNQDLLNCPDCGGHGQVEYAAVPQGAPPLALVQEPQRLPYSTVPMSEQMRIGRDAWQREPGDPHYGVPPLVAAPGGA